MLSPATLEVLQRVEADSIHLIESSVRAEGERKYEAVKKTKRELLLQRAKRQHRTDHLDDTVIRKQTNLASANASRVKKTFMYDALRRRARQKTDDALILAKELRTAEAFTEQLTSANAELKNKLATQQKQFNLFLRRLSPQGDDDFPAVFDPTHPLGNFFEMPCSEPLLHCTTYKTLDQTLVTDTHGVNSACFMPSRHTSSESHGQSHEDSVERCVRTNELKLEHQISSDVSLRVPDDNDVMKPACLENIQVVSSDAFDSECLYLTNPSDHFAFAA